MTDNNFEYNNLLSKFKDLDKSNKNVSKSGKKKRSNKEQKKEEEEEEDGNTVARESKTEESTIDETAAAATADEADMDENENVNNDKDDTNSPNDESTNNDNSNENDSNQVNNDDNDNNNDDNNDNNDNNENNNEKQDNITNRTESNRENRNLNKMAANEDDNKQEEDSQSIEKWLQDNKLYNSELLVVLKANHVDTVDDLKTFFEDADDLASTIKSVRKRTEKVLAGFSKKVTKMTGVDYEYKAPRHRAKEPSNVSSVNGGGGGGGAGLLNASGGGNGPSGSPRNRSLSNSSQGSTGSIGSYTYRKHKGRPAPTGKEIQVEANAHNSSNLKSWLQSKNIFNRDLFMYLANHGYQTPDDLEVLTEKEFDKIVREVRVETFKDVDTNQKRNRVDKLLTKFEVEWRKLSGNRKTNMTKEQQEQWGYSPRTASQRKKDDEDDDGGFFS